MWTQQKQKVCHTMGNAYSNLAAAKTACKRTPRCMGVYDYACDNRYSFYMCDRGMDNYNHSSSCVYKKPYGESSSYAQTIAPSLQNAYSQLVDFFSLRNIASSFRLCAYHS